MYLKNNMFQKSALFPPSLEQSLAQGTLKPQTMFYLQVHDKQKKYKAIPATGRRGP
jgi:hypothetical protein